MQVLERAKEGESLEDLRARTASQFFEDNGVDLDNRRPSKKRKQAAFGDSHISFDQFAD
jgi:multiple RNA-binding domain-containing protein 1